MTRISQAGPIGLKSGSVADEMILRNFAEFWKVPYHVDVQNGEMPIFSTCRVGTDLNLKDSPVIISPSGREEAERVARVLSLNVRSTDARITLPSGRDNRVSLWTEVYQFSGPSLETVLASGEISVLSKVRNSHTYLLSLDLVGEYSSRVYGGLEDSPTWQFLLASKLPFSYRAVPRFIRDRYLHSSHGSNKITEEALGPVECLRTVFLASLVLAFGPMLRIGFWQRGKSYALAVTHDIESARGLEQGAARLLKVERSFRIRSSWNLPSDRFTLNPDSIGMLRDSGEIGGHDTRHDGKLALLGMNEKVRRLKKCRDKLERELKGERVRGFRAPLLQHSRELAVAEFRAGYEYDSSCPSWEILSPTSLRPHGVGTIFPFEVDGILEIPVSLPQDHQLIRVSGQKPSAAVDSLLRLSKWIRGLGGPCVLLVHPDYELGTEEHVSEYRRLLESFASDPECSIMTLGDLADWWRHRECAQWDLKGGGHAMLAPGVHARLEDLQAELVKGYGSDGFEVEVLS